MAARKFLLSTEVSEVVVVGPDFKRVRSTFKVVSEEFEGADDGKEFFVVDVVVLFCGNEGVGIEGDRVPAVEFVGLF